LLHTKTRSCCRMLLQRQPLRATNCNKCFVSIHLCNYLIVFVFVFAQTHMECWAAYKKKVKARMDWAASSDGPCSHLWSSSAAHVMLHAGLAVSFHFMVSYSYLPLVIWSFCLLVYASRYACFEIWCWSYCIVAARSCTPEMIAEPQNCSQVVVCFVWCILKLWLYVLFCHVQVVVCFVLLCFVWCFLKPQNCSQVVVCFVLLCSTIQEYVLMCISWGAKDLEYCSPASHCFPATCLSSEHSCGSGLHQRRLIYKYYKVLVVPGTWEFATWQPERQKVKACLFHAFRYSLVHE
jgi:hypothetical protein